MLRKTSLILALSISTISLSGCSSIWSGVEGFAHTVFNNTVVPLRGSSTKSETTVTAQDGVYQTQVGEYRPTSVNYDENGNPIIDTSPHPCPEGTYLTDENSCMVLVSDDTDMSFDSMNTAYADTNIIDTSSDCPDGTYLTEDNACMFFETETFGMDLISDTPSVSNASFDSFPTCPDGTYLTADNSCMYLDNSDLIDYNVGEANETACPPGFKLMSNNSCMYLGAQNQSGHNSGE